SGYQPIGGSIVCDEVAEVIGSGEFNHGYTYSGHPVASAVALENIRLLEEENILDHVRKVAALALKEMWHNLGDHPLVGETTIVGMLASLALTPNKESRAKFAMEAGTAGFTCRERCFANNLIMRHVYDRMVISPPLVITPEEIKEMGKRARSALDECYTILKEHNQLKPAT
ncbi:MAG: aminotransferase class III-fold pyridoxal phosphate-dependent enzyme, partial [Tateyamaria sp.]|nr:aminotransferase class III-fold pyridoxal phosphate-dependent enzyme [Tateyamaria sp.]